jgi:hypothetical protein
MDHQHKMSYSIAHVRMTTCYKMNKRIHEYLGKSTFFSGGRRNLFNGLLSSADVVPIVAT